MAATHAGMTTDEFAKTVADWLATARHPRFKRPYTELVYQPMLELLAYLRANGFKTFIVSGGGVEFMRVLAEKVYGIPPEQVVGSSGVVEVRDGADGKPVLVKEPKVEFVDDGPGKPVGINRFIGRRPIFAFGNSDGDQQMLQWTAARRRRRASWASSTTPMPSANTPTTGRSHIGKLDKALDEAVQARLDRRRHEDRLAERISSGATEIASELNGDRAMSASDRLARGFWHPSGSLVACDSANQPLRAEHDHRSAVSGAPDLGGDILSRQRLTGDWDGARDELGRKGVVFDADLLLTPQINMAGGRRAGANLWGNMDYTLNVDTQKLGWWPGGFFKFSADTGFGSNEFNDIGAVVPPNTAALLPGLNKRTTVLTNATMVQFLSPQFGVLGGKINTLDLGVTEFYGDYRTQFENAAFNFPMTIAQVPISTFGGGVIGIPREDMMLSALVLAPAERRKTTTRARHSTVSWFSATVS